MENKHSQIRVGSSIRCLLTSDNPNFERDFYLTDAWLPEINLWVGEYPYLLRPAFEEICYIYLNRQQMLIKMMNSKLNFKIVGSGPTGLLLSIALSKFDCNIFLTDLLLSLIHISEPTRR